MAQNTTLPITNVWTLITDSDVTEITFQNVNGNEVFIQGTTAPTAAQGILYNPMQGERLTALTDLFPGVSGANRVWARLVSVTSGSVFVSHA